MTKKGDVSDETPATMHGHNSNPKFNPALSDMFKQIEKLEEDRKQINLSIRDLIQKIKEEHGVIAMVTRQELRLRKLDPALRQQYKTGLEDVEIATSFQYALELMQSPTVAAEVEDPVLVGKKEKAA